MLAASCSANATLVAKQSPCITETVAMRGSNHLLVVLTHDELLAGIRDDFTMQIENVLILKTLQKTLMKVIQNLILI